MNIALLRETDLPAVYRAEVELFGAEAWSPPLVAAEFESPYSLFYGAFDAGETLLGYAAVGIPHLQGIPPASLPAREELQSEVLTLATLPSYRGQGIGAALLTALEAGAKESGAGVIFLEVRESNAAARRLYARGGYQRVSLRKNYYKDPPEPAVVMAKTL